MLVHKWLPPTHVQSWAWQDVEILSPEVQVTGYPYAFSVIQWAPQPFPLKQK